MQQLLLVGGGCLSIDCLLVGMADCHLLCWVQTLYESEFCGVHRLGDQRLSAPNFKCDHLRNVLILATTPP